MRVTSVIADIIMIAARSHGDLQDLLVDDHTIYLDVAEARLPKKIAHGNTASKPATPTVGQIYLDTQINRLFECKTAGAWTEVFPADHENRHTNGQADEIDAPLNVATLPALTSGKVWKGNGSNRPEEKGALVLGNYFIPKDITGEVDTNDSGSGDNSLYAGYYWRAAITKDYTGAEALLSKMGFYLKKVSNPPGNVYFRIRKVSNDDVIFEQTLCVAGDLTTEFALVEIELSELVILDQNLRLCVEYDEGDTSNRVNYKAHASELYVNEYFASYNGSWSENTTQEVDSQKTTIDATIITQII